MGTYSITINERTASGKGLLAYLRSLGVVREKNAGKKKKSSIEESLTDIENGQMFESVDGFSEKIPCNYSVKELKTRIYQSEMDFADGLGCSQQEMRKRHLR